MIATSKALREVERLARELERYRPALAKVPIYEYLDGAPRSLDAALRNLRLALVALDLARVGDGDAVSHV